MHTGLVVYAAENAVACAASASRLGVRTTRSPAYPSMRGLSWSHMTMRTSGCGARGGCIAMVTGSLGCPNAAVALPYALAHYTPIVKTPTNAACGPLAAGRDWWYIRKRVRQA